MFTNSMVLSSSVQHVNISLNYIVDTGPDVFGLGLVIRLGRDVEGASATTPADPGGLSWLADSAVLTTCPLYSTHQGCTTTGLCTCNFD